MKFTFPESSRFYYSKTFAAAQVLTGISNHSPGVAALVAHGYLNGDILLLGAGWEELSGMLVRVANKTNDTFELENIDTTDTNLFPAGGGVGTTVSKVSAWVEIPGIIDIDTSGGNPTYTPVQLLRQRRALKVPTGFESTDTTLTMAHDSTNLVYKDMLAIARVLTQVGLRLDDGSGGQSYGYGWMVAGKDPIRKKGQVNQVKTAIAYAGDTIAYSS